MRIKFFLAISMLSGFIWGCVEADITPFNDVPIPQDTITLDDAGPDTGSESIDTPETDSVDTDPPSDTETIDTKTEDTDVTDTNETEQPTDTGTGEADTDTDTDTTTAISCNNALECLATGTANIDCCDGHCVNPLTFYMTSVNHCGNCANDCKTSKKGNSCLLGSCACGTGGGCVATDMCCKSSPLGALFFTCGPC